MDNGLDWGLLGGMRSYEADQQQKAKFRQDMVAAQQSLFAKSLEIQDFIEGQKARTTERRVGIKILESEERMLPDNETTTKAVNEAQRTKAALFTASYKAEERARPLFGITAENYDAMIKTIPEDFKNELGLTGNSWAEDGTTIIQAKRTAIDSAAHMRSMELTSLKGSSSGATKAKAINLAKKNLMVVDQLLKNDDIYSNLDKSDGATYRANVAAVAQELYQQNVDAVRNKQRADLIPYSTYVNQVKKLADKYVSEGGMWSDMFNSRSFNAEGFNAELGQQFGIQPNPALVNALQNANVGEETLASEDVAAIPAGMRKAVDAASDVISTAREEQNIPSNVSDVVIFNKLVEAGYLNKDGTKNSAPTVKPPTTQKGRKSSRTGR